MEGDPVNDRAYIDDQNAPALKNLPFGKSTVGRAGCEMISCYNALTCFQKAVPLAALIDDCAARKLFWRGGLWGMRPRQMRVLLRLHGLPAQWLFGRWQHLEAHARPGDAVILTTWNPAWWKNGLHSYLCIRKENGWLCLNNRHPTALATLRDAARGRARFSALLIHGQESEKKELS